MGFSPSFTVKLCRHAEMNMHTEYLRSIWLLDPKGFNHFQHGSLFNSVCSFVHHFATREPFGTEHVFRFKWIATFFPRSERCEFNPKVCMVKSSHFIMKICIKVSLLDLFCKVALEFNENIFASVVSMKVGWYRLFLSKPFSCDRESWAYVHTARYYLPISL